MARNGRKSDGTFAPGHKFGKGRPPRNYSIAHAMSIAAEQPQSVDDDGNTLTDAQLAARWLWRIVREGLDERKDEGGKRVVLPVATKDRLSALQTILSRIEPEYKLRPEQLDAMPDEEAEAVVDKLKGLSDEELKVLEKLGVGKGESP